MAASRRAGTAMFSATLLACGLLGAALLAGSCDRPHDRQMVHSGDCVTCHQMDYASTSLSPQPGPGHAEAGFPTTCADCHTTNAWIPASALNHSWWTIDGAHTAAPCARCHHRFPEASATPPWTFPGTPTDCHSCHLAERATADAANPTDHPTYSTSCGGCHTTTAWLPALGHPETQFPIQNGAHAGIACTTCHVAALGSPAMGANTDCVQCHVPMQDGHHRGNSQYQSLEASGSKNFCLHCHSDGRNRN